MNKEIKFQRRKSRHRVTDGHSFLEDVSNEDGLISQQNGYHGNIQEPGDKWNKYEKVMDYPGSPSTHSRVRILIVVLEEQLENQHKTTQLGKDVNL